MHGKTINIDKTPPVKAFKMVQANDAGCSCGHGHGQAHEKTDNDPNLIKQIMKRKPVPLPTLTYQPPAPANLLPAK